MAPITFSKITALSVANAAGSLAKEVGQINEQLSSGFKFNRIKDFNNGEAVAVKLSAEAEVGQKAAGNIDAGITVFELMDSALQETINIMQRMQELASQAAGEGLSDSERSALDEEYQLLDGELDRISSTTEYNGINLLAGEKQTSQTAALTAPVFGSDPAGSYAISADGRYVFYNDGQEDFRYDRLTGTTADTGLVPYFSAAIAASDDGRYSTVNDAAIGILRYDWSTGSTELIADTAGAPEDYRFIAMSADGRYTAFSSYTNYLSDGTNSGYGISEDIYLVDHHTGTWTELVGATGLEAADAGAITFSPDGSKLAIAGDLNAFGNYDVFVFDTSDPTGGPLGNVGIGMGSPSLDLAVTNEGNVYYHDPDSESLLYYDFDTSSVTTIASGANTARGLKLSNDNERLFFLSADPVGSITSNGQPQLYALSTGTNAVEILTNFTGTGFETDIFDRASSFAHVSADGGTILYGHHTDGLYVVDAYATDSQINIAAGSNAAGTMTLMLDSFKASVRGVRGYNLGTASFAESAAEVIDRGLGKLNEVKGNISGALARLQSADRHNDQVVLEKRAAEDRIRLVDAAETLTARVVVEMKRDMAASISAQANLNPLRALELLQDVA